MATIASKAAQKETVFEWEGRDRNGRAVRGEMRAAGVNQVQASLRRQGVLASKIKKRRMRSGKTIKQAAFDALRPAERAKAMAAGMTVVD